MTGVVLAIIGLALGGLLKGATGAGAPIIAVPVMAMFFDVPIAVAVFAVPSLISNIWQSWAYRKHLLPKTFMLLFAGGGALGVVVGTFLLVYLPGSILTMMVALTVFIYVAFRLALPDWVLSYPLAEKLSPVLGSLGGMLFGALGLSAPVTVSFLNVMRLERAQFIATVSLFFTMLSVVQIPALFAFGIMNGRLFLISAAALVPVIAFMPLGAFLARHVSKEMFDKLILVLLTAIAIRLAVQGWTVWS